MGNRYFSMDVRDRFFSKVDKSGECWLWVASRKPKGYGQFWFRGCMERAHRVAWILEHGEIPVGLMVLHSCDTPMCVRPSHLFLGTAADNAKDRDVKGRFKGGWRWQMKRGQLRLIG